MAVLASLQISEWQEIKGGSFTESLEAWQNGQVDQILGLCFLFENRPVGMVLFKRPPLSPSWVCADAATIHGLKVTSAWQGQGFGHAAFELAIETLKKEWPDVTQLMLAVDADNAAAIAVYRAYGMTECEPVRNGNNGPEFRFEIALSS